MNIIPQNTYIKFESNGKYHFGWIRSNFVMYNNFYYVIGLAVPFKSEDNNHFITHLIVHCDNVHKG